MTAFFVLAAAKPWTYWLALPLLGTAITLIAALAFGYYRKVLVPRYEWSLYEHQLRQSSQGVIRPATSVTSIQQPERRAA